MRLNPRNLVFIVALVVVLIVLIVLGNQGGDGEATPTPDTVAETGSLFPELVADQTVINRFEVRELPQSPDADATEEPTETATPTPMFTPVIPPPTAVPEGPQVVVLRKDADNFWAITEATFEQELGVDQATATGTVSIVATLEYNDRFSLEETGGTLDAFGLEEPAFEIILASTEEEFRMFVGNQNPAGTRYYVRTNDDTDTVYLVVSNLIDNIVSTIQDPPYVPSPTPTATPTNTPNPFSEVEQTQTAEADLAITQTAIATLFPSPTSAPVGPGAEVEGTEEVMEEATEDATEEPTEEATEEPTEEATEEATEEPTEEATEES